MRTAIMQPYFFPAIGYFQLIAAVDTFVYYDTAKFKKKGWIHRNNFLINKEKRLYSLPLQKASQNKDINEIELHQSNYEVWKYKFLKSLEQSYKRAPYFKEIWPLLEGFFKLEHQFLYKKSVDSIEMVCNYLDMETDFLYASELDYDAKTSAQEKIIAMNRMLNASTYINLSGGVNLYNSGRFEEENITLKFIQSNPMDYEQNTKNFVPYLSIVDVMMYNSKEEILKMLLNYSYL